MTRNSIGYSHDSNVTMISSNIPLGTTFVLSANSKIVGVGRRKCFNCNSSKVVIVITLMAALRSMTMRILLMVIITTGFPGFAYFVTLGCSNMYSYNSPTNETVGGYFLFPTWIFDTQFLNYLTINRYILYFL
jgi:hypothetical protein